MFPYVPQLPAIVKRAKKLKKLLSNKELIIATLEKKVRKKIETAFSRLKYMGIKNIKSVPLVEN